MDGEPFRGLRNLDARPEGYAFGFRCAWCGGTCAHVTGGQSSRFDARAVASCVDCRTEWLVSVQILDPRDGGKQGFARGRTQKSEAQLASMAKARAAKHWHRA